MLRQHTFGVGFILLGAAQGLGGGIELRVQRHQHAHVVVGVAGQLPQVLLLEGGQLGILFVQGALGFVDLAGRESRWCCLATSERERRFSSTISEVMALQIFWARSALLSV